MNIRRLVASDWEAYRSIRLEALQMAPEAFGTSFEEQENLPHEYWAARLAAGGNAFVLGAFSEERIIGIAGFGREPRRKTRHKGNISGVYVSPAFRGRGVARELLTVTLSEARSLQGLEQVTLCVVTDNVRAKALYLHLGFRVFGTELRALKLGERYLDEEHMVLFFQPAL
jgi:RimJ/RimL family protein N-acetyltransferase